jgi:hypothetical protein
VRFNDNKYSVSANAIGRLVEAQAHTEAHSLDGASSRNMPVLRRGETITIPGMMCRFWLAALRNGAPFKE